MDGGQFARFARESPGLLGAHRAIAATRLMLRFAPDSDAVHRRQCVACLTSVARTIISFSSFVSAQLSARLSPRLSALRSVVPSTRSYGACKCDTHSLLHVNTVLLATAHGKSGAPRAAQAARWALRRWTWRSRARRPRARAGSTTNSSWTRWPTSQCSGTLRVHFCSAPDEPRVSPGTPILDRLRRSLPCLSCALSAPACLVLRVASDCRVFRGV